MQPYRLTQAVSIPVLLLLGCNPPLQGDLGEYTDGSTRDIETGCGDADPASWVPTSFTFDPPLLDTSFAGECSISVLESSSDSVDLSLACGEQAVQLHIPLDGPLGPVVAPGDTVMLDYRSENNWGLDEWYTLRRPSADATLLLAGMQGDSLEPPGPQGFFAPLTLAVLADVCPKPVHCEAPGEDLAVEFTYGAAAAGVFPGHHALLGDPVNYRVAVSLASENHWGLPPSQGDQCSFADGSSTYFSVSIQHQPG
ncbi:hypothetical protein [Nannocystis punicea]|uniref:Uncharacterized protein n=1 Tax=Nannocystis punicea TaxID=2995304 RepID=A0ABY7HIG6_9BACT|nr:hypothetical protein [Nannocystis poenicansa]WAS98867.1 hypothetical protein O0S08_22280 [Nannocystis poenicansa]